MKTKLIHNTAFAASIIVPFVVMTALLFAIPISGRHDGLLNTAKLFWFTGVLFVVTNAIGFLFGNPINHEINRAKKWGGWDQSKTLVISYVSRGNNDVALRRAITTSRLVLDKMGVNYIIEAVTDIVVSSGADRNIVVPADYQTANGARYKARAMHFASQCRPVDRDSYILHMDEESVLTSEVIIGISNHIKIPGLSIGQGEIKYNAHNYGGNILITSIDAIRTGDDLGRFRFQYKLFGRPLFGMHGSFFVVPSLLEHRIGFDLGGKGSITEDAYFALIASDLGVPFRWVEGFIREQSPFSLMELLKQRRRWITGLKLLMFDRNVSRKQRIMLGVNMTLWRLAWIGPIVTFWNVVAGGSVVSTPFRFSAAILAAMVGAVYMVGAYRNVIGIKMRTSKQVFIWLAAGLLAPISCLVEGSAVIYSIISPVKIFEVVNKN
jgi:beta-1,4-mannosyltransferase